MKNSMFAVCILSVFVFSCSYQNNRPKDCDIDELVNMVDSVSLEVVMIQNDSTAPFSSDFRVVAWNPEELISDSDLEDFYDSGAQDSLDKIELKKIKSMCWLYLLNHPNYNWETNLFLYFLFEEDASHLIAMEPREWREVYKEIDITFWEEYLESDD